MMIGLSQITLGLQLVPRFFYAVEKNLIRTPGPPCIIRTWSEQTPPIINHLINVKQAAPA